MANNYKPGLLNKIKHYSKIGALSALSYLPFGCGSSPNSSLNTEKSAYSNRDLTTLSKQNPNSFANALMENLENYGYEINPNLREALTKDLTSRLSKPVLFETSSYLQEDGSLSRHGLTASKPVVQDMATKAVIPSAKVTTFNVTDIGDNIVEYRVIVESPGHLTRETKGYADKGAPLKLYYELVAENPDLVRLRSETSLPTPNDNGELGTGIFKEPPTIYISTRRDRISYPSNLILPEDIAAVQNFFKNKMPLANNGFSANPVIVVGDEDILIPNGRGKMVKEGYILIQFTDNTPGWGEGLTWDINKDGWLESSYIALVPGTGKHNPSILEIVLAQEGLTAYGAYNFPKTFAKDQTVLHEESTAPTFTALDIQLGKWLYSRPANNRNPDKDDGWELDISKIQLPGDFNYDLRVDFSDFVGFAQNFGTSNPLYDIDGDGIIGFSDFVYFAKNFGRAR